jgi:CBS domain-containing membrane protein
MATSKAVLGWWRGFVGIELSPVSHRERLLSALGGCFALILVYAVTRALLGPGFSPILAAPIGATAVLLFAVPHGAMSQPWPVIGGHAISAAIGVACASWVPDEMIAAGLAVGLATAAMYYLRCIHPPGGAIALLAVIGGDQIHGLGFGLVLAPVLINAVVAVMAAIVFNAVFPWRRYPAILAASGASVVAAEPERRAITHEDFVYALTQMDSFIDVSEEDLLRIYALATGHDPAVKPESPRLP